MTAGHLIGDVMAVSLIICTLGGAALSLGAMHRCTARRLSREGDAFKFAAAALGLWITGDLMFAMASFVYGGVCL